MTPLHRYHLARIARLAARIVIGALWYGSIALFLAALLLSINARAATCPPWEPATAPYRGDAAAAVASHPGVPDDVRAQLVDMVRQRYGGQRVLVARDRIVGANLGDLRDMNGAGGHICRGPVDRSRWPAGRHEAAWAYTVGPVSVLVLDSCGNVAVADNLDAPRQPTGHTRDTVRAGYRGSGTGALSFHTVPEPGALALLALLGVAIFTRRNS